MKKLKLTIKGMHCKSCKANIEAELDDLGVKSKIDFKSGTALLEFDENKTTEKQIINTIKKLGYSA